MAKQTLDLMISGGKATAAPPLGPALGPTGLNVAEVIKAINQKTAAFNGMEVPVKLTFDASDKSFEISIGTPSASALLKSEGKVEKGSGRPNLEKVADVRIEQIIKIAKMKEDGLGGVTLKDRVKEIIGTCCSMGFLVQGMTAKEAIKKVDEGRFDKEIKLEKTELTAEELKQLEEEKKKLAAETEKRRAYEEKRAVEILAEMVGKTSSAIKHKMMEEGISKDIIDKHVATAAPAPAAPAPAGSGAKAATPTAAAAPAKK